MVFPVRIYRMHDLDLMMLLHASDIAFGKMVKRILRSYIRGNVYRIDVSGHWLSKEPRDLPNESVCRLSLDEEIDAEIIRLLSLMTDGYKNSFIKHTVRMYIEPFALSCFYADKQQMRLPINALHDVGTVQPYTRKRNGEKKQKKIMEQDLSQAVGKVISSSHKTVRKKQVNNLKPQNPATDSISVKTESKLVSQKEDTYTPVIHESIPSYEEQFPTHTEEDMAASAAFFNNLMKGF